MLARLLQGFTVGMLAFAAAWAWLWARAGHGGLAIAGALLVLGSYVLVLALEFVFMGLARGSDPAPRPTAWQVLRAWSGEVLAAPRVFCWRQPFRSQLYPDLLPEAPGERRGVLLVHGFVCNRGLWNPWLCQLRDAGIPVVAVNLEPVFGSIDAYAQPIEAAVQRLERSTGMVPVIVAHSMGGLALRRWCAEPGNAQRFHRAITIGTPHRGTWLARWAPTRNSRQMQQHSRWLLSLAEREPAGIATRFTCFYSHCDHVVFPASTATLPGADNRHLTGVAHVHMADRPEPWAELMRWISPAPSPSATAPRWP